MGERSSFFIFCFVLNGTVTCPDDITMSVMGGQNEIAVTWTDPTPDGSPSGTQTSHDSGAVFSVGRHAVLYSADYVGGDSATCFFYVTITGKSFFNITLFRIDFGVHFMRQVNDT